MIVARALTEASVDDATTGITLIEAVDGALGRVTADAAYDTIGFYEAAGARGATVVVPPTSTANVSRHGPRSSARDRTILAVKPGFPFCLSRMAPLYTRPPPSGRNSVRRTSVQLQRLSLSPR